MKYEKARELHKHVHKIRAEYEQDMHAKMMMHRQRAVATYLIDKVRLITLVAHWHALLISFHVSDPRNFYAFASAYRLLLIDT